MVLEAESKLTGDNAGRRLRVYIPVDISIDSAFPFKSGDTVRIRIDRLRQRLIIEKKSKVEGE